MKIGIIGCGYVGQAAALYWKQQGCHVAVTTRDPQRVSFLQSFSDEVCLLNHPHALPSFIAAQERLLISVAPDSSSDYHSTYLKTALQVAEYHHSSPSLRQILYTSSTSVYGDHQGGWVYENTAIAPIDEKNKILYETEQILLKCSSNDLKICILRLGEIYGPQRRIEDRLRRMHTQPFPGSGAAYTNLIHLTDIVGALAFCVEHDCQGIYNLCSDFHISRRDFYADLCQREHLPPIEWNPSRSSHRHQGNKRVSNEKIKKEGFVFTYSSYS